MMYKIENENYRVEVSTHAAEITSFYDKKHQREYMWQGDEEFWAGRNPILFPIIGSSYDQKYHFGGRSSSMGNHGFMRHAEFEFVEQTADELVLRFRSDDETFKQYPYHFSLEVTYSLRNNQLKISYRIFNEGVIDLYANFGLHPAFNCPIEKGKSFEDYYLDFQTKEKLLGDGPKIGEWLDKLDLNYDLFEQYPTFMYSHLKSPFITLTDGEHGVRVSTVGYPITAIWTPNAPFVCIEPWNGLGKSVEKDLDFKERDATFKVSPERHRLFTYTIEVF